MPGINKDQQSDLETNPNDGQEPQQAERELTQTDRINRHLLVEFLQSLNRADANTPGNNLGNSSNLNSSHPDDSGWNDDEETQQRH